MYSRVDEAGNFQVRLFFVFLLLIVKSHCLQTLLSATMPLESPRFRHNRPDRCLSA